MSKLDWILMFIEPGLRTASQILRNKDENTTGKDDEIAEAIDYLLKRLAEYKKNPTG